MGNTLTDLMQTEILPLALAQLRENCVMPALVLTDFKGDVLEYKSTIRIPKPQNMGAADDVATDLNAHGETQDTNLDDDKVDIILDKWKYKQFSMTDKEIDESVSKGILPSAADGAIKTLANQVDSDLLALYKDIPYAYGQAGVTPSKTDDLTGVSKVLNKNLEIS